MHGDLVGGEGRQGLIAFIPSGGSTGRPSTNTAIRDGRYAFSRRNGPVAGKYRVRVQLSGGQKTRAGQPAAEGAVGSGKGAASESTGPTAGRDYEAT